MPYRLLRLLSSAAILLAFFVVMLGAYTRLTNAGLGCPDWPGCYGQIVLPKATSKLMEVQRLFPTTPIETTKAWTEMAHRYAAGTLSLLIMLIAFITYKARGKSNPRPSRLPFLLIGLIAFQAALGMWTVTLKLLPIVVMGHLLGGMLILGTLTYFRWQQSTIKLKTQNHIWKILLNVAVLIVFCQIALGGWVSANYAGIACIGFPTCNGVWLPKFDYTHAFQLFSSLKDNYQGGLLDSSARITIQMLHRFGALITAGYVLIVSSVIIKYISTQIVRKFAILAIFCVLLQFTLGVMNVLYLLPLDIAVAHNGVAALLFAVIISLRYLVSSKGGANVCPRANRAS